MTFNIHHGKGTDKKLDLERIGETILHSGADIIGLNEVDKEFSSRSEFMDQAQQIADYCQMEYAFGPAITISGKGKGEVRQYGSAILTRFPIVQSENYPFDFLPRIVEDRALLEVIIHIEGQNFAVYTTHLSLAPFLHGKQTEFILNQLRQQQYPSIILGDWNMKPYSSSWRLVSEQLIDTWVDHHSQSDQGYTYPSDRPRMKLDYIFTTEEFTVLMTKVLKSNAEASDHLPLFATLQLPGSKFTQ